MNASHPGGSRSSGLRSSATARSDANSRLHRLGIEVAGCSKCPRLVAWREQVAKERRSAFRDQQYWGRGVPGFGDPGAALMVVGLAPAAHGANRTGRMFTGDRSGDWLYRALYRAGFANQPESTHRDDGLVLRGAWVTSPVKCAPPANKPAPDEVANCEPFLSAEFAALTRLRVVVALGGIGFASVTRHLGVRPRPRFGHGVELDVDGLTVLASYHVSQQNTFTGRLTEHMLDAVFLRARELTERR